jgi:hypothetical protein
MALSGILTGLGGVGSDIAGGQQILAEQRRNQLADQLRQFQLKMQFQEFQQRMKEFQDKQSQQAPGYTKAHLREQLGRDPTDEEVQRYLGVQAPQPKSKYSNFRVDEKGQLHGFNTETNKEELIPGSEGTKFGKTPSPLGKIDPIIAAQVGKPPDPSQFPQGESDPAYKATLKIWGAQAETIKNRMASAGAVARGQAYGAYRYGGYITPDGELVTATAKDAADKGYVPAAPGFQAMSKQAQFGEIRSASGKLRDAISSLQPGDAFTPTATVQLTLATRAQDASSLSNAITNAAANSLNDRQQDAVVWVGQMMERVLSIRSIAGMGQGAEDLRRAIQSTVPSIVSGNTQLAMKRLDAVDNQVNMLYRGIPKVSKITGSQTVIPPPPPGATLDQQ